MDIKSSKLTPIPLEVEMCVSTPSGDIMLVESMCKDCILTVRDMEMKADLLILEMKDFDLILVMDWLADYHVIIDCFEKAVKFQILGQAEFSYMGGKSSIQLKMISALQAKQLLRKGCEGYLATVLYTQQKELCTEDIPIVNEFPNVFPDELPGLPPDREIDFSIDLIPGTGSISKTPYRMAPVELRELKK